MRLKDEHGQWKEGDELLPVVSHYFKNIFQTEGVGPSTAFDGFQTRVSRTQNDSLVQPFTCEEVRAALFAMHPDKSPGLDGMNPAFFQKSWNLVGSDVCKFVLSCLSGKVLPDNINDANIVLIPKKQIPESVFDLRPIALSKLEQYFEADEVLQIHRVPVNTRSCDGWFWLGDFRGAYTVKSAYRRLMGEASLVSSFSSWGRFWRIPVAPKVLVCLWRAIRGILPTQDALISKRVEVDGGCPLRGGALETIDHIFLFCPFADSVWRLIGKGGNRVPFISFPNWFQDRCQNDTLMELCTIDWTCWAIWKARNIATWDHKTLLPGELKKLVLSMEAQWSNKADAEREHTSQRHDASFRAEAHRLPGALLDPFGWGWWKKRGYLGYEVDLLANWATFLGLGGCFRRGHSCHRPRGGVCMAEWGHFGVKLSSLTMVDNFLYLRLGPWLAYGDYGKNNLTLAFVGCNR
ncbi:unnamed protein product [Cuscuta campestris]|uniref:Reverse transcriptase zinc-binding domain-containing protein n=1 Tax=Cuscuta campestris TaxID=132261 RepID=A0A484NBS4_9ASTE|nr:unnamed protein product [Cuscuta campestris]